MFLKKKKGLKGYLLCDKNGIVFNDVDLALRANNYVLKPDSDFCMAAIDFSSVWMYTSSMKEISDGKTSVICQTLSRPYSSSAPSYHH